MPHMKVECNASQFALGSLAFLVLLLRLSGPSSMAQSNPVNSITIREKAGVATNNYPIQIGRVFKQGEISNFPNAVVNGTSVKTQADIKSRWPDQSVKHAILSFYIPTLKANGTATVTFTNQATVLKGKTVEATTSVTSSGNRPVSFNATMELTSATGQKISASVRDMISANKYTYWTQGPISSSVIVADHSEARAYDIGFDPNRSFRPIFHVTFWPAINKIKVRYIGEIANTLALQDMNYSLVLKLQDGTFKTVYSRPSFRHVAAGRWTKEFWSGGEPAKIEINHNLAYLRQTLAVPNFDTSFVLSEVTLQGAYENPDDGWMNAQKEIFDRGNIYKAMPTAGGRDELGPYPTWVTRWLYSGDWRMYAQSKGNAELSAAFPVHFREGLGNRNFDRTGPNALGRVLSISARPTVFLHRGNAYIDYFYTEPADKIVPVGSMSKDDEWLPDCAHQPDYHSALYTLTGDYFYLEEMNFWASWSAVSANFTNVFWYGRGPTGDTGGVIDEVRGDGWIMRGRAQAAFLNPDGSAEKAYFTRLISDAVAIWEGTLGITGTANENTASWIWGRDVARKKFYDYNHVPHQHAVPPLGFWEEGHAVQSWDENVDFTKASIETSPWMHYILVYGLGRAKELGYPTDKVLTYAAKLVNESLTDANYNPYLACSYQMPTVRKSDDDFYTNWADVKNAFLPSFNPVLPFTDQLKDGNHGYALLLQTAASMTKSEPNGAAAWSFVQQNIVSAATAYSTNPKWAILPRQ